MKFVNDEIALASVRFECFVEACLLLGARLVVAERPGHGDEISLFQKFTLQPGEWAVERHAGNDGPTPVQLPTSTKRINFNVTVSMTGDEPVVQNGWWRIVTNCTGPRLDQVVKLRGGAGSGKHRSGPVNSSDGINQRQGSDGCCLCSKHQGRGAFRRCVAGPLV